MAGVYGDMLLAWPEQKRILSVYDMTPKVNGGWELVKDQQGKLITTDVMGVFQNTRGGGYKDSNGNLVKSDGREFWTRTAGLDGKFFQWESEVYRLKDTNNWSFEGGFFRYGIEKVVGNNGTESDNASWNLGSGSFG